MGGRLANMVIEIVVLFRQVDRKELTLIQDEFLGFWLVHKNGKISDRNLISHEWAIPVYETESLDKPNKILKFLNGAS